TILPVTMILFDVKKENRTAVAEWKTTVERHSYFNIERSADNLHFLNVGKINGGGNTNGSQQYRFVDRQPLSGTNYYRLKRVDINGNFAYSITKRLDFKDKET